MLTGQLSGRTSLRDIAASLKTRNRYLYHLGMRETSRSPPARVNEQQSTDLYEKLFGELLVRCQEVADIYKHRWQMELFFKRIQQNLKIKTFLGTSCNAVMTQIWIAMIAYLLIAYFKFKAKLDVSLKILSKFL